MIGRLRGVIAERAVDGSAVLDVDGVGYEVWIPLGTLGRLAQPPEPVTLHVHTHVREDAIILFGFADATERAAFRTMLGVSGVGPKLALAVLSSLSPQRLAHAIASGEKSVFKGIPGVGTKTAERLLLELKDKLPAIAVHGAGASLPAAPAMAPPLPNGPRALVAGALVTMGFKQSEAEAAVAKLREVEGRAPEYLVVEALRHLT